MPGSFLTDDLDATDITLLQHPELWDNTLATYYDICGYGAGAPAEKKRYYLCFDCKEMTTLVKSECCDGCWDKLMKYKAVVEKESRLSTLLKAYKTFKNK